MAGDLRVNDRVIFAEPTKHDGLRLSAGIDPWGIFTVARAEPKFPADKTSSKNITLREAPDLVFLEEEFLMALVN